MRILQMIVNDTMTESECITMTESGDYVTVTESEQWQKALCSNYITR